MAVALELFARLDHRPRMAAAAAVAAASTEIRPRLAAAVRRGGALARKSPSRRAARSRYSSESDGALLHDSGGKIVTTSSLVCVFGAPCPVHNHIAVPCPCLVVPYLASSHVIPLILLCLTRSHLLSSCLYPVLVLSDFVLVVAFVLPRPVSPCLGPPLPVRTGDRRLSARRRRGRRALGRDNPAPSLPFLLPALPSRRCKRAAASRLPVLLEVPTAGWGSPHVHPGDGGAVPPPGPWGRRRRRWRRGAPRRRSKEREGPSPGVVRGGCAEGAQPTREVGVGDRARLGHVRFKRQG